MINYDFVSAFKKNIILINTSRGNVVNQTDLLKCISENKLTMAALDVLDNEFFETHTENEKKMYKSLFSNNKIIFTPHIAGKSHSTRFQHAQVLANKILALIKIVT
jgi:D-3-phosphoglycerate dehydrogenase